MKYNKISLSINIIIVLLVTLASIFMFTGIRFMPSKLSLESNSLEMFKYFTVDSNLFLGIVTLIFIIYKLNVNTIPKSIFILKFMATSAVMLTFIVTLFFLVPQYGFYAMYSNNNLFFHLIVPILSFLSYVFFDNYDNRYKYAIYGILPMFLYSIFYILNILLHLNNGGLTYKYDFYGFLQGNLNNIFMVIPTIFLVTYLISLILIFFNKKI